MMRTGEAVLFLDVDGVLNRGPDSGQGLESDKVALLQRIVAFSDPLIVVSSTWRYEPRGSARLMLLLQSAGARYGGCTPVPEEKTEGGILIGKTRGEEIQQWLDLNGRPSRFVILDDDSAGMENLTEHAVKTQTSVGLTEELAYAVMERLGYPAFRPVPILDRTLQQARDEEL